VALPGIGFGLARIGGALPPDELTVLSSNATKAVLDELAPSFEKSADVRLVLRFAPSAELKARIQEGEAFDVAFLASPLVDELVAAGKVDSSARSRIARVGVGVAILKGARRPDLSSPDAFRRALLEARTIAYVGQGVTADILRNVIERFGIEGEMGPKTKVLSGVTAAEAVASGEAELGFTQVSEILPHPEVELAGTLPAEVQVYTTFEAILSPSSRRPDAARRLIDFLTAPAAAPVLRAKGMEPG